MAVTIGQDASGNAIVTGDNNQTFVFYGVEKLPQELLADIHSGRKRAADIPEAVPLPALTLAIDFEDEVPDAVENRRASCHWSPGCAKRRDAVA
jgi:hypothetical protein